MASCARNAERTTTIRRQWAGSVEGIRITSDVRADGKVADGNWLTPTICRCVNRLFAAEHWRMSGVSMAELPDRNKREARMAGTLSRLGSRQRRELEALLGNPPDIDRVPESYWTDKESEMGAVLLLLLTQTYSASARLHGMGPVDAKEAGSDWATKHSETLARDFTANSQKILANDAKQWDGSELTKRAIRDTTLKMLGPDRMARVAVNETTRAQFQGGEDATEELWGLSPEDTWKTSGLKSVCPVCLPLNNQPRRIWEPLFPAGPPEPHVGCSCLIRYHRGPTSRPKMEFQPSDFR